MQLTQQIRIEPTKEQESVLSDLSERCRLLYNFGLAERRDAFDKGIKGINYRKQQDDLPELKKRYPEYVWVNSKVLQMTLKILDANYKSFFALNKKGDKNAKPPKFRGSKYFTTMLFNQSGYSVKNGFIALSHKHPSGTELKFRIPKNLTLGHVYQISIYKRGKEYYLSIIHENKPEKEYKDNGIYQAFDLGVAKHTAVNSKGKFTEFTNQRPDRYWASPIKSIQSRKDHCRRGSRRWNYYNKVLNSLQAKSSNQMKDIQHKLSRQIIENTKANTIIVGDLSVKEMSKKENIPAGMTVKGTRSLHRVMQNTGSISRFIGFLTYKAELAGKRVIKISERDTTKACCRCGKKKDMALFVRVYECDCGNIIDRDRNSAVNIMSRFLSQNALWQGYRQFADNLRQTGIAIQSGAVYSEEAHTVYGWEEVTTSSGK
jgi:putative transposase